MIYIGKLTLREDFAGKGAFSKALTNIGVSYELIDYCEKDKYVSCAYSAIHDVPEEKNRGDIRLTNEKELSYTDVYTFGSPCQDFSVAGKGKGAMWSCNDCEHKYNPLEAHHSERNLCPKCKSENIEKTRSSLVVESLRIIKETQPKYIIFENVKNLLSKKHRSTFDLFLAELKEYKYNTYDKILNAKDYYIPQKRERVLVVGIREDVDNGDFEFPKPQPLKLKLKDILESNVDEKYYLSENAVKRLTNNFKGFHSKILNKYDDNNIASCLFASMYKICRGMDIIEDPIMLEDFYKNRAVREYKDHCPTLRANRLGLKVVEPPRLFAMRGRYDAEGKIFQNVEFSKDNIANTLTTVQKDNLLFKERRMRRLTPLECFRLMSFSDEDYYKAKKALEDTFYKGKDRSDSQMYKMAGNSIVVKMLEEVFKILFKDYIKQKYNNEVKSA